MNDIDFIQGELLVLRCVAFYGIVDKTTFGVFELKNVNWFFFDNKKHNLANVVIELPVIFVQKMIATKNHGAYIFITPTLEFIACWKHNLNADHIWKIGALKDTGCQVEERINV